VRRVVRCRVETYLDVAEKKEERAHNKRLQRGAYEARAVGRKVAPLADERPLDQQSVLPVCA
jgi:hypothetical protein